MCVRLWIVRALSATLWVLVLVRGFVWFFGPVDNSGCVGALRAIMGWGVASGGGVVGGLLVDRGLFGAGCVKLQLLVAVGRVGVVTGD